MLFNSFILYASVPAYRYFDWYVAASRDVMYTEYASILHWYQSQDVRRLVMKSPSHMSELRALLAAVPNALIVQTHRDPVNVVNRFNSLIHTLHTPVMRPYVPAQMIATNLRVIDMMVKGNLAARDALHPNICDVFYDELVSEPIGTVKKIYVHFELAWDDLYEEHLAAYMAENQRETWHASVQLG